MVCNLIYISGILINVCIFEVKDLFGGYVGVKVVIFGGVDYVFWFVSIVRGVENK